MAGNVQDLPPCAPETANWMTVMDQLRVYESEMKNHKSTVEANRLELIQHKSTIGKCEQLMSAFEESSGHVLALPEWPCLYGRIASPINQGK